MCGIVGCVGIHDTRNFLLKGLNLLEYRGYDSAGMALVNGKGLQCVKAVGMVRELELKGQALPRNGSVGIAHTRWATHGGVTEINAHPHFDSTGEFAIVHNGVIENYQELREDLIEKGGTFHSNTDTEVMAHLIGYFFARNGKQGKIGLMEAIRQALGQVVGTYGIAVIHADVPGVLMGARHGSSLVLGIGSGEYLLASDIGAIVPYTHKVIYLNDCDIVCLGEDGFEVNTLTGLGSDYQITKVDLTMEDISKAGYPHYMLKEIFEQPVSVRNAIRGRLSVEEATAKLGGLETSNVELRTVEHLVLSGCGTAFHAGMVGKYLIESFAHISAECEFASELRYRNLSATPSTTFVFVVSQSGETADTLAALRESRRKGYRTLGICNHVASTIARESDGGVYMHAGLEIGVAATKSFTSQLTILTLISLLFGRIHRLSHTDGLRIIDELEKLPEKISQTLELHEQVRRIARKYVHARSFLFLGRQFSYPVALEGALKLTETSYIAASGHPSAELKHGIIALVAPEIPSVFIAPEDSVLEKNLNSIQEVKARRGPVIAIGTEGNKSLARIADDVLLIPEAPEYISPILTVIPLQLLAYYIAVELGRDVDKPRNLAKSVTVE